MICFLWSVLIFFILSGLIVLVSLFLKKDFTVKLEEEDTYE